MGVGASRLTGTPLSCLSLFLCSRGKQAGQSRGHGLDFPCLRLHEGPDLASRTQERYTSNEDVIYAVFGASRWRVSNVCTVLSSSATCPQFIVFFAQAYTACLSPSLSGSAAVRVLLTANKQLGNK